MKHTEKLWAVLLHNRPRIYRDRFVGEPVKIFQTQKLAREYKRQLPSFSKFTKVVRVLVTVETL